MKKLMTETDSLKEISGGCKVDLKGKWVVIGD
jgi:hypothetical protein